MGSRKKRKKAKKRAGSSRNSPVLGHGFDLGWQEKILIALDPDFDRALRDASIFACAYGFVRMEGYPGPLPTISLVGEHSEPLQQAFAQFKRWGCEEDGDAVYAEILLRRDGGYLFAIGPETERALHRLAPYHQLLRPLMFGLRWIKQFDTVNPMLHRIAEYRHSPLAPVVISAGTADLSQKPVDIRSLAVAPDLPRLVKFSFEICCEQDHPDHWLLRVQRGEGKRGQRPQPDDSIANPQECARLRRKTIDVAFPVSRDRIRRAGLLAAVRGLGGGFEDLQPDQIMQAAINLVLSAELTDGKRHFVGLGPKYRDIVWEHIFNRAERVDLGNTIRILDPIAVAAQAECDIASVLAERGMPTKGAPFQYLQTLFQRKGYVGN